MVIPHRPNLFSSFFYLFATKISKRWEQPGIDLTKITELQFPGCASWTTTCMIGLITKLSGLELGSGWVDLFEYVAPNKAFRGPVIIMYCRIDCLQKQIMSIVSEHVYSIAIWKKWTFLDFEAGLKLKYVYFVHVTDIFIRMDHFSTKKAKNNSLRFKCAEQNAVWLWLHWKFWEEWCSMSRGLLCVLLYIL